MGKNSAKIDTRKNAVEIMEKNNTPKNENENAIVSDLERFKSIISAEEKTEIFTAEISRAKNQLRKMQAELFAKVYAPICAKVLESYFSGANDEEINAEITAFNTDTKNATILISPEQIENETACDTYTTETRTFYGYTFAPETAAKAARLVNYWLEYRRGIVDSLAAKVKTAKAAKAKAAKAEKSATELLAEKYGVSVEQLNAILAANLAK